MPGRTVDVLALDRDGKGDAHLVDIRKDAADSLALVPALLKAKSPFRWIAFYRDTEDAQSTQALKSQESLFARDTSGRVGVIEIVRMENNDLGANIRIKAERFPTPTYKIAAEFAAAHEADLYIPD
jgi:hypothetical protein